MTDLGLSIKIRGFFHTDYIIVGNMPIFTFLYIVNN